jgi:hypothetical protein
MKRQDNHSPGKTSIGLRSGLAATALVSASPLMAHPDAAHTQVTGTAHGLAHALMGSPVSLVVAVAVISALWVFIRVRRTRLDRQLTVRSPELTQE